VLSWVGIDGYGTNNIVQVGVQQTFSGNPPVLNTVGWWDWLYPGINTGYVIDNFTINPGDTIVASVTMSPGGLGALLNINNLTRNTSTNVSVSAAPAGLITGQTAEWIVEKPGGTAPLANFGQIGFVLAAASYTDAFGGTAKGEVEAKNGTLIDMVDGSQTEATTSIGSTGIGLPAVIVTYVHD
jgi:hypothetical protein